MKPWEQRITALAGIALAALSTWFLYQLEKNRFQNPFAADVGVEWEKMVVVGGINTVPVQHTDALILTNNSDRNLDNVEIVVSNWNAATEIVSKIGTLKAKEKRRIELIDVRSKFPPYPYEIDPCGVLIVRCPGFADKRMSVKDLGKEKALREIEKEEDKEKNADADYWRKFWAWEDELARKGIEPTKDMFDQWFKDKEEKRKKKK